MSDERTRPDQLGLLYFKERTKRRVSLVVEPNSIDVPGGSSLNRRRLSKQFDGPDHSVKVYCELSGHLLEWWEEFGPERKLKGRVSLLSLERVDFAAGVLGFVLVDAAKDSIGRRGDLCFSGDDKREIDSWMEALNRAFVKYNTKPLSGLGPTQAAREKPILKGEMLVRDTNNGIPMNSWTTLVMSLFDNRIEFAGLTATAAANAAVTSPDTARRKSWKENQFGGNPEDLVSVPARRVDHFTINFYVGDSRVHPHAFLISDFIVTHHFAAKDDFEKLFWMQTIAKVLRNLVAMHEHAIRVNQVKATIPPPAFAETRKQKDSDDDDDDDDDEEDNEQALDKRRPMQVRKESLRRFYGLGLGPDERGSSSGESTAAAPTMVPIKAAIVPVVAPSVKQIKPVTVTKAAVPLKISGGEQKVAFSTTTQPGAKPTTATPPTDSPTLPKSEKADFLQRLAKAGSGIIDTKTLSTRLNRVKPKRDSAVLTVYSQDVAPEWLDKEYARLKEIACKCNTSKKKSDFYHVTFRQLVSAWGEDDVDDLAGVLLRAKRNGVAKYEGDMLFVGFDDAVNIQVKASIEEKT